MERAWTPSGDEAALRRIPPRRRPGLIGAILLLFLSPQAFALEREEPPSLFLLPGLTAENRLSVSDPPGAGQGEEPPRPGVHLRVRDYVFYTFPRHLLEGAQSSFWGKNLAVLAVAGGVAGALLTADDEIQDFFRERQPIGRTARRVGDWVGTGSTLFGLAGTTYALGEILDHRGVAETGEVFLEGLSLAGLATGLLKITTQRRRPDNSDTLSFPSGHASGSFAMAAMVDGRFGPTAGVPAYLAAAFASFARLQRDKHHFSDTLFGAVLGTVVGYAVVKLHRTEGGRRLVIAPLAGPEEIGLQVGLRF